MKRKFYEMEANKVGNSKVGNVYVYAPIYSGGAISEQDVDWVVTPKSFRDDLAKLGKVDHLNIHLCTPGGSVIAGSAIYSTIKQLKVPTTAYIEGEVASMGTVVAMACDEILMDEIATMMVHHPMQMLFGYYNKHELDAVLDDLAKGEQRLVSAYCNRTGMTVEEVTALMDGKDGQGTVLSADECIENGMADGFIDYGSEELAALNLKERRNKYMMKFNKNGEIVDEAVETPVVDAAEDEIIAEEDDEIAEDEVTIDGDEAEDEDEDEDDGDEAEDEEEAVSETELLAQAVEVGMSTEAIAAAIRGGTLAQEIEIERRVTERLAAQKATKKQTVVTPKVDDKKPVDAYAYMAERLS